MESTMNSVLMSQSGHIQFGQTKKPSETNIQPKQVLIRVEAAALNPSDILFMRGKYEGMSTVYPFTPGWEGSGTVIAGGDNELSKYLVGKRVAFMKINEIGLMTIGGAMGQYCLTSNRSCIPLTDDVDFEHASSFFVNPLTAIGMVERCKQLGSKATLVTAAASQIGRMIMPLLISEGIIPICTVRKEDQAQICRDIVGPKYSQYVLNESDPDFKKKIEKICMKLKPKTCLDSIAGDMTGFMLQLMGYRTTLILYGLLSDKPAGNINAIGFMGKGQTMESFLLTNYMITLKPD
jgi:NADPH2:quinone reductase